MGINFHDLPRGRVLIVSLLPVWMRVVIPGELPGRALLYLLVPGPHPGLVQPGDAHARLDHAAGDVLGPDENPRLRGLLARQDLGHLGRSGDWLTPPP